MIELIVSYAWYIVNGEKPQLRPRSWCSGVCRWLGADASTSSTATRKMHRGVVAARHQFLALCLYDMPHLFTDSLGKRNEYKSFHDILQFSTRRANTETQLTWACSKTDMHPTNSTNPRDTLQHRLLLRSALQEQLNGIPRSAYFT